jgi:uncharacterized membrane protein YoaT (DUF817 family)
MVFKFEDLQLGVLRQLVQDMHHELIVGHLGSHIFHRSSNIFKVSDKNIRMELFLQFCAIKLLVKFAQRRGCIRSILPLQTLPSYRRIPI